MNQPIEQPVSAQAHKNGTLALLALAISAFGIGTTEFVPVGLLASIADDLSISITLAGFIISGYAIGVAIGAPVLTALTNRMNRKTLLLLIMVIFIAGNLLAALSTSFALLIAARFVTAFSHGVFFSIGATIAVQLVPAHKKASAIALMFTGLTVATVTGVPLGTFIGQSFGWRATFFAVAALGIVSMIASYFLIPKTLEQSPPAKFSDMVKLLTNSRIVLGFAITALGYGGTFVAFTYLTPIMQEVIGLSTGSISLVLLAYGIAVAAGNWIGGKLANNNPANALFYMFIVHAIIMIIMSLMIPFKIAGLIGIILMGLFAFMNVPGLQLYIVQLAEKYVPAAVDVEPAEKVDHIPFLST